MSNDASWTRVDESVNLRCCPDAHTHRIIYYRKYTTNQGFAFSDTNNLISNFQKGPTASPNVLPHRQAAIKVFTKEVTELVSRFNSKFTFYIVPTPPSKARANSGYDSRMEDVAYGVAQNFSYVEVAPCLETIREIGPSKANISTRSWQKIYDSLAVDRTKLPPDHSKSVILILDDILTSGAHFEAIRRKLRDHIKSAVIAGIYWARAVNP